MKKVYIYGLVDPRNDELRYIGKTVNLKRRMNDYRNPLRGKSHNKNWLINLKNNNLEPEMIVIDVVDESEWEFMEIFYINYFRSIGCNLNNHREGGNGFTSEEVAHYNKTRPLKEETRKKYSERTRKRNSKLWKLIHPCGKEELVLDLQSKCKELFDNPISAAVELRKPRKSTGMGHYKGFKCIKISND